MTIGERIRTIRKEKGLTQQALGRLLNVTQSTVGQYETNKNPPKIPTLEKIAAALDVPLEALTGVPDSVRSVGIVGAEVWESMEAREDMPQPTAEQLAKTRKMYEETMDLVGRCVVRINDDAARKLVDYAQDLTRIPEYLADMPLQPTPSSSEGKDTTPADPPPETAEDGG